MEKLDLIETFALVEIVQERYLGILKEVHKSRRSAKEAVVLSREGQFSTP